MKKIIFILLICLILFISGCITGDSVRERLLESSTVVEVIDGDTIILEDGRHIRLLNINAPEKNEACYQDAKARLEQLVLDKQVWLERDKEDYDRYDRKLRYIFLEENKDSQDYIGFVNLILLEEGLVKLFLVEPNSKYKTLFREKFEEVTSGCLFQESESTKCFSIIEFHYDAEENDCDNPNDEYVSIENSCEDIDMNDWKIKDAARHVYTFENFIAKKGSFILYSGLGQETETELFWNRNVNCPAVWNNDHDTFYLYDNSDELVLEYNY